MKKKVKITVSLLAILFAILIIGICVYVNVPVEDFEYGIKMTASHVTPTGLKLHVERDDTNSEAADPMLVPEYELYELRICQWFPVDYKREHVHLVQDQSLMSNGIIKRQSSYNRDIDWEEVYGRLPTGLYYMAIGIGRPNRTDTLDVPFFVINWLQILGTVMTFCVIGIYIWVLYRFQLWNKIIRFIITKRKTFLIILGSFAAVGIGVLILHLMVPKRDSEWGIGLKVVKSSQEEIIFELTREGEKKPWDIITGNSYGVERWTLWGWKDVRGSSMTTMEGILVSEEFSHQWLAETMYDDGHMPSGLYRIVKNVTVKGYYKYDATGIESMELTYYAPFFIGVWWEILLIIIGIVLLPLIVWAERRFKLIRRGWKKVVQYRKQSVLIMSAILLLLLLARVVHTFWGSEISAAVHGYEIEIEEINEEIFLGKIRYLEDDNEKERRFMQPKQEFELQALTLLGWQTIQKEKGNALIQPVAVREGNGAAMRWYWKDEIDKLEPGTYRIKQPFDLYQKSKGEKPGGNVYVEFEVE